MTFFPSILSFKKAPVDAIVSNAALAISEQRVQSETRFIVVATLNI
jgi:hypothetical protein